MHQTIAMKDQKLLETLADISYLAGENNFFSGNSRSDVSCFILWAIEFEKANSKTDWDEIDYILSIEEFTRKKIHNSLV